MFEHTLRFCGLDPSQRLAEDLALPILPNLGGVTSAIMAVDQAASVRRGILLIAPKGCGKSEGLSSAIRWFTDFEHEQLKRDNTYRVRAIVRINTLRNASYRDTGVTIAKALSGTYWDRTRGKKRDNNEVRGDVVQRLFDRNVVVLAVDDAETCSDETILFLRDLMAQSEEEDPRKHRINDHVSAAGVGVVLSGTEKVLLKITAGQEREETGERWVKRLNVPVLSLADAVAVIDAWVPGFTPHIKAIGLKAWENYLGTMIWKGQPVTFRMLDTQVRLYHQLLVRSNPSVKTVGDVYFDAELFEYAIREGAL